MSVIGVDIGGANLKGASAAGVAFSESYEIWRAPGELTPRLNSLLSRFPCVDRLAVTMTAELADCFETKREGVVAILGAIERAAPGVPISVWGTDGCFLPLEKARELPMRVAAANWHALATWAGRLALTGISLLVDIGSTTADIIPLLDGVPCPRGTTDVGRLLNGELIYTGVRRTPVFAVAPCVPLRGQMCPLAAEIFATTLDAHLVLGGIAEDASDRRTANGRPATIDGALNRLARAVCCDRSELDEQEISEIAAYLVERQVRQLIEACHAVLAQNDGKVRTVIVSGEGEFLARRVVDGCPAAAGARIVSLQGEFTPAVAESACAYAIAVLAAERRVC